MKKYQFNVEELRHFAKKVYQEACFGYMDLADSSVEVLLEDFLKERKFIEVESEHRDRFAVQALPAESYFIGSDPSVGSDSSFVYSFNYTPTRNYFSDSTTLNESVAPGTPHQEVLVRPENNVRPENFIR